MSGAQVNEKHRELARLLATLPLRYGGVAGHRQNAIATALADAEARAMDAAHVIKPKDEFGHIPSEIAQLREVVRQLTERAEKAEQALGAKTEECWQQSQVIASLQGTGEV